jgi:hypothetical protein
MGSGPRATEEPVRRKTAAKLVSPTQIRWIRLAANGLRHWPSSKLERPGGRTELVNQLRIRPAILIQHVDRRLAQALADVCAV